MRGLASERTHNVMEKRPGLKDRRRRIETVEAKVGSTYFNQHFNATVHQINQGGYCVLAQSEDMIMTTLGSCISVCVYDPLIRVGGMNHFLLPENKGAETKNDFSMRYGNNAMEYLINNILRCGGQRERLVLKAFGAGNVLKIKADIGAKNIEFLHQYVKAENLYLETCDLGGNYPRRVAFCPSTGKVFVRILRRTSDLNIVAQETKFRNRIEQETLGGEVELF